MFLFPLLATAGLLYLVYYVLFPKHKNLPPGPWRVPLLGNALSLGQHPHMAFAKWAKQFGDIILVNILGTKIVVLSDYKLVKELYSQDAFSGRQQNGEALDIYGDGDLHGIVGTEGENWEQLRRFSLRQLRDFGFGKTSMEHLIIEEMKEVLNWMKSEEGKPVGGIKERMTLAVVNSLWTIMSSQRLKHDDPELTALTINLKAAVDKASESGGLLIFAPWIRHIAPKISGFTALRKVFDESIAFFSKAAEDHKASHSEEFSRDFMDVFIAEMKKTKDPKSPFYGRMGEKQLIAVIADLFLAGADTTSTTLDWTFLYLATFPEIQKKLQKEIERVTGNSRFVSVEDRLSMPYAESVLAEVLRCSSIVPSGLPHRTVMDREVKGYLIPKDALVMVNAHYIHYNPRIWGDPENFRPERYINPDGKTFKKHEALMPFSTGRRQCVGESLARDTLFLFITNIFQRFSISLEHPKSVENVLSLEPSVGLLLNPKPYKVIFKDRE